MDMFKRLSVPLAVAFLSACGGAETKHAEEGHGSHGMTDDFSQVDRWVAAFDSPDRLAWQKPDHVVELMEIQPGMTVVDLGAGTGYFLSRLSRAVGEEGTVLALDVAESLVAHMNERARDEGLSNVRAEIIPEDSPGLQSGSAQRILIVNTWHHIPDRPGYAAKLAEALSPGGRLYIVDFTLDSERGPSADHKLPAEQVVRTLTSAGLSAKVLDEELPEQYVVVGIAGE